MRYSASILAITFFTALQPMLMAQGEQRKTALQTPVVKARRFEETRKDYEGTPFTYSEPVVLPTNKRPGPRLKGNWYPFAPQQAKQVVNLKRFPKFAVNDYFSTVYHWKLFRDIHTFDMPDKGFTHFARQDEYIGDTLPFNRRAGFYGDSFFYNNGVRWADELAAKNPDDKRIKFLRALGKEHRMVIDEDTCKFLAEKLWEDATFAYAHGIGCEFLCLDMETDLHSAIGNPEEMFGADCMTMMGLIYREAYKLSVTKDKPMKIFSYGIGFVGQRAGGWGEKVPNGELYENVMAEYRSGDPKKPFNNHPIIQAFETAGGFIGIDKYMRNTWDSTSYYKINQDGTYAMRDGKRLYREDDHEGVIYGQKVKFGGIETQEPNSKGQTEAEILLKFYIQDLGDIYSNYFWFNGGKTRRKFSEKVDPWKKTEMCRWLRFDTEPIYAPGARFGERPIYDKLIAATVIMRSFYVGQWFWDATQLGNLGEEAKGEPVPSKGSIEAAVYARHRAENVIAPFMKEYKDFYYVRPTRGNNEVKGIPGSDVQEGPIMGGWLAERAFAFWACYIAQDETPADAREVNFWYDDGKVQSPAYKIRLENRDTVVERIELPNTLPANPDPKYLRFQFTDLNGNQRTWSGDYEFPVEGNPVPPPLYLGKGTTPNDLPGTKGK